jgi:hypothetical protein
VKKKKRYKHKPKSVETGRNNDVTIYRYQKFATRTTLLRKKKDITLRDKKGICVLPDVSIPSGRTVVKKEADKILKHKDHWLNTADVE